MPYEEWKSDSAVWEKRVKARVAVAKPLGVNRV